MPRTISSPGRVLALGLAAVLAAALAPAGVDGRAVPAGSWAVWAAVFALALGGFAVAGVAPARALRRLLWLLPMVLTLALSAALFAPRGRGPAMAAALGTRALAAAAAGAALATVLGPAGLVAGLRALRAPARLVELLAESIAGIAVTTRQVRTMLVAREARRPGAGAWAPLAREPLATARAFGRLVAALLLRTLERAEALDRARRARGGIEP